MEGALNPTHRTYMPSSRAERPRPFTAAGMDKQVVLSYLRGAAARTNVKQVGPGTEVGAKGGLHAT
jgi:hypothetical protein